MKALRHFALAMSISAGVLVVLPVFGQQDRPRQTVIIHVTDFGINQPWSSEMRVGDSFYSGQHELYTLKDKRSQVLIPMPSDDDMKKSTAQLSELLAKDVIQSVDTKIGEGLAEFEIQLVQHVGPLGYADPTRQAEIKKFGQAVYAALGELVRHIASENRTVTIDVTAGSNGTVALSAGAQELSAYKDNITRVDLVDGRASRVATADAIGLIGAGKVRIINTHGDFSAPPWSIGNYDAARSLKSEFPALTSLLLTPKSPGLAHIQWMLNPDGAFDVVETVLDTGGTGKIPLGTFSPAQFRSSTTYRSAHDRAIATRQKSSSPENVADELDRLAGYIDTLKEFVQATEKIANKQDLLPPGFSLLPAALRDEADTIRSGDRTWLASHKVDALASECLSRLQDVINKLIGSGALPASYTFLSRIDGASMADIASAGGEGHLDTAGLTKLLDDVSKYTASVAVRLLLSPLGPEVSNWAADATESFVDIALPVARAMTADLFLDLYRNPVRKAILDQWITAQNRRMASGQPVQDLQQMYGAQVLADAGFSQDFLDQNAMDTKWFNSVAGSLSDDGKDGNLFLAARTGTAHPITLGSRSWDTASQNARRRAPTDSVPATEQDAKDCKGDNCSASILRKKPDPPSPCPPFSPGCACPPGTPGCGGGTSAGLPPSICPPDDPGCASRSRNANSGASCPPRCADPPPAILSALLNADWRLLASLLGGDDRQAIDPITRRLLAHALAMLNRNPEAFTLFASSNGAADLEAYYLFAVRFARQHPASWTAQYIYGDAMARRGDFSSALQAFTAAMNLEPTAPLPLYARGVVRSLSGDDNGAVLDLTKATQLSPTLADGWLALAILWLRLDAADGAQAALSETIKLSQDSGIIHLVHGILLFDDGDSQGAIAEMRRAGLLSATLGSAIAHDMRIVNQRIGGGGQSLKSPTAPALPPTAITQPRITALPRTTVPLPPRPPGGVSTKEIAKVPVDRGESRWSVPYPLAYEARANSQ